MTENTINIEELVQDDHNLNRGTEAGQQLMEKSFKTLGAGRSILVDRDGRIIAGQPTTNRVQSSSIELPRCEGGSGLKGRNNRQKAAMAA